MVSVVFAFASFPRSTGDLVILDRSTPTKKVVEIRDARRIRCWADNDSFPDDEVFPKRRAVMRYTTAFEGRGSRVQITDRLVRANR